MDETVQAEPGAESTGRIVAVANLKGGTGKSTLAVNLACLAARGHPPVLLVDADPQGTAAAWLDPGELPEGLAVESLPVTVDPSVWADRLFAAAHRYARIVIDLPPQLGPGIEAALGLVDALVIPVTPSAIDLRATAKTLRRLKAAQRARDGRPACLLVPNRVDQRTAVGRAIQQALRDLDFDVAPPISQRASHAMAFAARQWIGAHAPASPALREMAAVAAKLEALLEATPANDYCVSSDYRLSEDELISRDDLVVAAAVRPTDEEHAAAARRREVDAAPLPGGIALAGAVEASAAATGGAAHSRRVGWLASLFASVRLLGRPHTG
jgi:chromosome partitioning protein